jgi:arylsulfatase A-like enzyme
MSSSAARPNVFIVTVDCIRRDRLSAYGYERLTTPFLDSLLGESVHATSAHSASSWTAPSVCSLLTGLYPGRHGGGVVPGEPKNLSRRNLPTKLSPEVPTLADRLGELGYATGAFGAVWNAHLPLAGRFQEMTMLEKAADRLIPRALRWVREQRGPFLLWLHLGDTHEPLDVPPDLREAFGPVPRARRSRTWAFMGADDPVGSEAFVRYRDARIRLYDAAVRSVDRELEGFFDELSRLGLRENSVFVVSSDHGEEFWEHRDEELASFADPRGVFGTGHGHHLFQVHLLVPLLILAPDLPPRAVRENVSLVDVVPTVLELVGASGAALDGVSLTHDVPGGRPVFAESIAYGFEKRTVIEGDRKLLSAPGDRVERLYELGPDRREVRTVDEPGEAHRLRSLLPSAPSALGEQVEATDEIIEHLRGLGYLE